MRICHVITRLIVGGAQENTLLTCEGLVERGHDVTLVAGPETGPEGSLWARAEAGGGRVVRVDSLRRNVAPYHDLRCAADLRRILRELRCEVVHTHSSKAGILGRWAARRAGVPTIVHTIHGMSFNRTQAWPVRMFYRLLERRAARWTDGFVTVADAMAEQAVAAGLGGRDRFTTIYSGMRTERFAPDAGARRRVREKWGVSPDHVVAGTVARLFPNKGYEELIAMLPLVLRETPELRFVWVGGGPEQPRYAGALRDAGVLDRVRFTGLVAPDDIPAIMNGFDLLVHTSRWEGLPRAAVQALLTNIPVVSFDIDGVPEVVVHGKTGRLVPLGDIDGLTKTVAELARSPVLRQNYGHNGRILCLERFDHRRMVEQIEALYARLKR